MHTSTATQKANPTIHYSTATNPVGWGAGAGVGAGRAKDDKTQSNAAPKNRRKTMAGCNNGKQGRMNHDEF